MIARLSLSVAAMGLPAVATATTASPDPLDAGSLLRVFGSLALVLGLILGLMWLLRRSRALVARGGSSLRVLEVVSVGQRERVVLLAVDEQRVLLGVSAGRVEALHPIAPPSPQVQAAAETGGFAEALRRASRGGAGESVASS